MGKTTMDGSEQALFESTELGTFSGHVFFDKLQNGDTIVVCTYIKDEEEGAYKRYSKVTIQNLQDNPAYRFNTIVGKCGIKITAQQTSGTYRLLTHQWFKQ